MKIKYKYLLAAVTVLILTLSVISCNADTNQPDDQTKQSATEKKSENTLDISSFPDFLPPDPHQDERYVKVGFWDVHHYDVLSSPYNDPGFHIACKAPEELDENEENIVLELHYGYYAEFPPEYDYKGEFANNYPYSFGVVLYDSHGDMLRLEDIISHEEFSNYPLHTELSSYRYSDSVLGEIGVKLHSYTFDKVQTYTIPMPEDEQGYIELCLNSHIPADTEHSDEILLDSVTLFYKKQDGIISFYTYSEYTELFGNS